MTVEKVCTRLIVLLLFCVLICRRNCQFSVTELEVTVTVVWIARRLAGEGSSRHYESPRMFTVRSVFVFYFFVLFKVVFNSSVLGTHTGSFILTAVKSSRYR